VENMGITVGIGDSQWTGRKSMKIAILRREGGETYRSAWRSRRELAMTDTLERLMARLAAMGGRRSPKEG
jgi:hypothetical protein